MWSQGLFTEQEEFISVSHRCSVTDILSYINPVEHTFSCQEGFERVSIDDHKVKILQENKA